MYVGVGNEDVRELRGIPVSRYVVHEHYDRRLVRNDIALLELQGRIRLGSKTAVTAACLPTPSSDRESLTGRHAVVTGWGTMSYGKTEQPGQEQAIDPTDCTPHQFHFRGHLLRGSMKREGNLFT